MKKLGIILGMVLGWNVFGQMLQYNRFATTPDGTSVNGNTLTNLQATSLQAIAASGILTNGNGKVDFDGLGISSDGLGNLTALSFLGNGGQLTGLSGSQLVGPISVGSLPLAAETNFDTRNWTNQSAGGIFANAVTANQFTGPLAGNATTANSSPFSTNALSVAGSHVYVGYSTNSNTYGFSTRSGWFNSTSKGQALQDAFNYYTTNLLVYTNNGGQIFTTNYVGLTFELGYADYNNPFYRPQGYYISNLLASASWHIYGQGFPNTLIVGDSNVLFNSYNNQAGATPFEEIDHVGLCFSNYLQKAVAVNLSGISYIQFHDCWITPLVSVNPTNYYFGWAGGDSAGTYVPLGYSSGIIDLVISGNTGRQSVHDNVFGPGSAGVVCLAEHQRFYNNEFKFIGSDSHGNYASQWATNDSTVVLTGDSTVGVLGADVALGAAVINNGQGDFSMIGDKLIGCGIGIYLKSVALGGGYGPNLIENLHFEALIHGPSADIVCANDADGASLPTTVNTFDCIDQNTSPSNPGGSGIWSFCYDTASFKLSTNMTDPNGSGLNFIQTHGVELSPSDGASPALTYRVNNVPIFSFDSANSNITLSSSWKLSGGGLGQIVNTNFQTGTVYVNNYGAAIQVHAMSVLTIAAVSGDANLSLRVFGSTTNSSSISSTALSIATIYTNALSGFVPSGSSYAFTNLSSGAGNSATPSQGQIIIY